MSSFLSYLRIVLCSERNLVIQFNIPPIRVEDAENFIEKLGWISEYQTLCHLIAVTIDRNPRKFKRFLSNLEVKRQIAETRDLQIKIDALVKMSCISSAWSFIWTDVLLDPSLFHKLQECALDPESAKQIGDNQKLKTIFETERQLIETLRQEPHISENELNEYIFLAKTTVAKSTPVQGVTESKYKDYDVVRMLEVLRGKGDYLVRELPSNIDDYFLAELEADINSTYQKLDNELLSGSSSINKKGIEILMNKIDEEIMPAVSEWSIYTRSNPNSPRPRELFKNVKSIGSKLRELSIS